MVNIDKSTLDFLNAGNKTKPTHKKHKYNAVPIEIDGNKFQSTHEGVRFSELKLQQHCGFISDLKKHPKKFILQEGFRHKFQKRKFTHITYTPDSSYIKDGILIYEDAKGVDTDVYILKRKMLLSQNPDINFQEYRR